MTRLAQFFSTIKAPTPGNCLGLAVVLALIGLMSWTMPALAESTRPPWRPPATFGSSMGVLFMQRIDDWQVTCYKRAFLTPINNECELRLHQVDYATGHLKPTFVFDLIIEPTPAVNPAEQYDFNIMLDATPTPSWSDGSIQIGNFDMKISDVCLIGPCILRHSTARRLVEEMLEAHDNGAGGIISFEDAPLTNAYSQHRIGLPLDHFDRALNMLIEQTQIHGGF